MPVNGLTVSRKKQTAPRHRVAGQEVSKKMERVEEKVVVGKKGRMVMLEITEKPQQQRQQQQQKQKRHVPPSLQEQEQQQPTPRVSIKLTSAARRNARTPTEVAKAPAAPVPAATILRGPSVAHRESGKHNGNSEHCRHKDDYSFLEDDFSFDDGEIEGSSSSPTACPFKAAVEATELAQKAKQELCQAKLVTEKRKDMVDEKMRDTDVAWVQQLSVKAMNAVTAASNMTSGAAAAMYTANREDPRNQATGSTAAVTAVGTCSPYGKPQRRKWKRINRNANASAATPPAGTSQPGERGTTTTAVMEVHKKRGIDATGTMATAAKPTEARNVSSDESEAALALAGLAAPASTRTPAAPARETQTMSPISDSADTATVTAGFSHREGDGSAGSPTVVATAAVGDAAIGSAPRVLPPVPAALPGTASAPAAGTGMAMEEEEPHSTELAVACIGATPWVMPPALAALPVPASAPAAVSEMAIVEEQACQMTAAAALLAITATPWAMPPAPAALAVPAAMPAVGGMSAMDQEQAGKSTAAEGLVVMPTTPRAMPAAPAALAVPAAVPAVGEISAMDQEQASKSTAAADVSAMPATPSAMPPTPAALLVPAVVPAVSAVSAMVENQVRSTESGVVAMPATPWSISVAPAALLVPTSAPAGDSEMAMDEGLARKTASASASVATAATPSAMPSVLAAVPAVGGISAMDEQRPCKTAAAASATAVKTAATWSMAPLLAALAVPGEHTDEQDGATGVQGSKKEDEKLEEGEIRLERKASIEVTRKWMSTLGYTPAEAAAGFAAAETGAAAAAAAAAKAAAAKVAKATAAKATKAAAATGTAVAATAAVAVSPIAAKAAAMAKTFLEPGALLASARASDVMLTLTTAVQQTVKQSPAVGKTVDAPPMVESVGQEAQGERNRSLGVGDSEYCGAGRRAEHNDTVFPLRLSPPAPSKIHQTAVAVAESLAAKAEEQVPLLELAETNSSPSDPTCAPVTAKTVADAAYGETTKGFIKFSQGAALDDKAPTTASTSSRDTAQLLLLGDRAVLRERKRAEMKMSSRSSLLTMASPARAAAARTRTRARFSRQARAARKALRREDVMSRGTVLWRGGGSNNGGTTTVGKEGEEARENRDDGRVTNAPNGAVEAAQTQSWSLSAEIVRRPQQRQQEQQERLSTLIRMHRIVSEIRTVRRAYKTDAFRLRVWRTSASRQVEV
ncbi:unnamed protein product, partial [Ectocarpus sp. 12 AP-2014]